MSLYLLLIAAGVVFLIALVFLFWPKPKAPVVAAEVVTPPRPSAAPAPVARPSSPKPLDPEDEVPAVRAPSEEPEEITIVKVQLDAADFSELDYEDEEADPVARTVPIVADTGAEQDEPTRTTAVILVSAAGQTDRGQKRKRNEDRFLRMDAHGVYAVADGMGGYAGGDIASETAVETIAKAFREKKFDGRIHGELPRRAAELARAVQMANLAIFQKAQADPHLTGMGTTIVATRFSLRKERVYLAHVGDSRCYRVRKGQIRQLTTDHTLAELGVSGPHGAYLSRAVGVKPEVTIDVIVARPEQGDVYLLCSDGLTKMVKDDQEICRVVVENPSMDLAAQKLVNLANERGGKDNVTVVLVAVTNPGDLKLPD